MISGQKLSFLAALVAVLGLFGTGTNEIALGDRIPTSVPVRTGYNDPNYRCLTNVYIEMPANGGSDRNRGLTPNSPIATLAQFNSIAKPGSCGLVGPGHYVGFTATASGDADTPTGYIVVKARLGPGTAFISPSAPGAFNTIDLSGGAGTHDYWIFDGLDIKGPPQDAGGGGNAIEFESGDFFKILNSNVHDSASACIAAYQSDYLLIYHNTTYNCAWTNSSATSCIDLGGAIAHDAEPGFHIVVSRNIAMGCAEGPAVTEASKHTDGNCFIADTFGAYGQSTLVDDNVFIHCGGRGLHIYNSSYVTVLNNTILYNQTDLRRENANAGDMNASGGGGSSLSNNTFCNNLVVQDGTYNSANFAIVDDTGSGTNTNELYFNNLTFNGTAGQPAVRLVNTTAVLSDGVNGNRLGVNPLIAAPSTDLSVADFHLQPGSPALGKGTLACGVAALDFYGNPRVDAGRIDMGAVQGTASATWTRPGVADDMLFTEQLFTGGGAVGSNLISVMNDGGTDLLPNSPTGYPFLQYGSNQARLAYAGGPTSGLGLLVEPSATNLLLNSAAPATQTTGVLPRGFYTLWGNMEPLGGFTMAGSLVLSNGTAKGCGGTATQGIPITFVITTAGTCTVTVRGQVYFEQLENGTAGTVPGLAGTSGIVTAGSPVTRHPDFVRLNGEALSHSTATPATIFFSGAGSSRSGINEPRMLVNEVTAAMIRGLDQTHLYTYDRSGVQLTAPLGSGTAFGPIVAALAWSHSGRSFVANGGPVATDRNTLGPMATLALGDTLPSGGNAYGGLIREYADWTSRLDDDEIRRMR